MSEASAPASGPGETAAAKINLALHVVGRRADGYHELDSLVVFAAIGDRLTRRNVADAGPRLRIDGSFAAGLPDDGENLVIRALEAFEAAFGALPGFGLQLTKNLPLASGLGGGSADAAAALRLAAECASLDLRSPRLAALAAGIGADVPMCLVSRPLRAEGAGERLTPWPDAPRLSLVLANPGVAVSTPAVFRGLKRRDGSPLPALPPHPTAGGLADWLKASTRNDLQAAAIREAPVIAETIERVAACAGCRLARMSGSGATVFGLFPDDETAAGSAQQLAADHPGWWVTATATQARQGAGL